MLVRRLAVLVWMMAALLARPGDATACGAFAGPPSEEKLAAALPFLTVEQVLILWDKETGVEDFIRETRFDRTGKPFGFVIPTPSAPEVFAAKAPFDTLRSKYGFEDPNRLKIGSGNGPVQGGGRGEPEPAVVVLSKQRIGSFVAFTLSASDPGAFDAWLRKNGFAMSDGAKPWIQHYVDLGFYFVALRYDAPPRAGADGGTASMTSETVRIRFRTPNPYYPYMEPAHASGAPEPERRMLTGWLVTREPMKPVAFRATPERKRSWQRPWREGAHYQVSNATLGASLDGDLRKLLPSSDTLEIQTFQDLKVSREGYGDVLLVPDRPESSAPSAAVLEERRRLVGAVDPTLLSVGPDGGLEDDRSASERDLDALRELDAGEALDAAAAAPKTRGSARGCSFSAPFRSGSSWEGVALVIMSFGLARRRRRTGTRTASLLVATFVVVGCRPREATNTPDAQVDSLELQVAEKLKARPPGPTTRAQREKEALAILSGASAPDGILPAERDWGGRGLAGITPRGEVEIGDLAQGTAPIADAARLVAGLRARFRNCYARGLQTAPKMAGSLGLSVDVGVDGEVSGVTVMTNKGVSASVATCCSGVLRRATFSDPKAPTTLSLVLTFRPPT